MLEDVHDGAVSPASTADATIAAGAMVGCVFVPGESGDVSIASKEWGEMIFYCEISLEDRPGNSHHSRARCV